MIERRAGRRFAAAMLLAGSLSGGPAYAEPQGVSSAVSVYWQDSATLKAPGVTRVVVLDETVCLAEAAGSEIRLQGLAVGDTVLFVWIGETRTSRVVHVTQKPDSPVLATLSRAGREAAGHGRAGTSVMMNGAASATPFVTHEYWDWQQGRNGERLSVRGFTNTYTGSGHAFNVGSFSIEQTSGNRRLSLVDFTLNMGVADSPSASLSQYGAVGVRGVDYAVSLGRNRFELFAGSTVPSFFLSFGGTRAIAGAKVDRTVNPGLKVFTTAGAVSAPVDATAMSRRTVMPFQTAGVVYTPSPTFSITATAGASSRGWLGDVQADYTRRRFAASVAATDTSSGFPLNRVQLLTAGESSVRATTSLAWSRISFTTAARHAVSKPGGLAVQQGSSDSISQSVQATLPGRQQLSANLTRNVSSSAVLPSNENRRVDASWSSPIGRRFSNTLQAGVGRNTESTLLNSYRETTFRDSASLMLPRGALFASFEHQRLAPSTPAKIRQVLDTLPAELRDLFSVDPILFIQTVSLPADVRLLLETLQPASSSLSVGGQFARGRLSVSPSFSLLSDTLNGASPRRSSTLGYSATWQLAPTWQLRSALSNRVFYAGSAQGFRRTNVLTFGIDKSLNGLPRWIAPVSSKSTIEGSVFRDNAVNGAFDANDPGLSGVRIRLDGSHIVTTDNTGHFRFKGVSPGRHHLSLDLAQFPGRVRVTTPSEIDIEVIDRTVQVNFGVVNFARVIGTIFNDYHNDASRQSDAPGLPGVRVRLTDGAYSAVVTSDSSGDYEAADLPPGDYSVTIAAEDLPANYTAPARPQRIHLDPIATVVADLPVRALRSISGRVLLKTGPEQAPRLEPIAGVTIVAAGVSATTDSEGRYALRDLPAGAVEIRVVPVREVPQNLHAPLGVVHLKTEPTRIENANIIISNPNLMDYLTAAPTGSAQGGNGRRRQ
jgi:hypothetical protein